MTEENNNIGLSWKKCALHIHTPCSNDFEGNRDITPQEFLEKMTNSNIEVCAITDHSSFGWIEDLRAANEKLENPIIIFPGTEIHTDDGMHLLVLFERNSELSDLDHFLVNLDIKKEEFGSDKKCDRKMEGKEIIDKIHDYAALAIFPHVKQDKGFFKRFKGTSLKKEILKEGTYIFECDENLIPD